MPRLCLVALVAMIAFWGAGCRRASAPPGGASGSKPEAARKQAESFAVNAVAGAGDAQAKAMPELAVRRSNGFLEKLGGLMPVTSPASVKVNAPDESGKTHIVEVSIPGLSARDAPQPKAPPRPGPAPIIRERVASAVPFASEKEAEDDAINAARDLIQRRFAEFDPPLNYKPSANEVRKEFMRGDSRAMRPLSAAEREFFAKHDITGNLVFVEFDVEVNPDQVRELRTRDRVWDAARVIAALTVVSLAGFLFLRLDEFTKGYLTRWLAVAAVLFAGGAAAALYWV